MKWIKSIFEQEKGTASSKRIFGAIIIISSLTYAFIGIFNIAVNFNQTVFITMITTGSSLIGLAIIDNIQPPTKPTGQL